MTTLLEQRWHAPAGYRVALTDDRVWTESAEVLSESRAEQRANDLNDRRPLDAAYEWCAVKHGRRWRLVAFRIRLEPTGADA